MLTIVNVSSVRTAKDTRAYFIAEFSAGFGQRAVARTFWQQFKRDPKTGEKTDVLYWERATPEQALEYMKSKTPIDGEKITRNVEPYMIGDRSVSTYSTVKFPDENEFQLFSQQNHPIVDEDGVLHDFRTKKVILAPASKEGVKENANA